MNYIISIMFLNIKKLGNKLVLLLLIFMFFGFFKNNINNLGAREIPKSAYDFTFTIYLNQNLKANPFFYLILPLNVVLHHNILVYKKFMKLIKTKVWLLLEYLQITLTKNQVMKKLLKSFVWLILI